METTTTNATMLMEALRALTTATVALNKTLDQLSERGALDTLNRGTISEMIALTVHQMTTVEILTGAEVVLCVEGEQHPTVNMTSVALRRLISTQVSERK